MLTIGLTGGIGCGKSTVTQRFAALGAAIIDADVIGRELVAPETPALQAIAAHFGKSILNDDAQLNRKKLREIIFKDADERRWLEQLLHPLILEGINVRKKAVTAPYCIVVIPLLLEKNVYQGIDRILVVDCEEYLQIQRVQQRDHLTVEQVKTILAAQAPRQEKLKVADDLIENSGNLENLSQQVEKLHRFYLQLAQSGRV